MVRGFWEFAEIGILILGGLWAWGSSVQGAEVEGRGGRFRV